MWQLFHLCYRLTQAHSGGDKYSKIYFQLKLMDKSTIKPASCHFAFYSKPTKPPSQPNGKKLIAAKS